MRADQTTRPHNSVTLKQLTEDGRTPQTVGKSSVEVSMRGWVRRIGWIAVAFAAFFVVFFAIVLWLGGGGVPSKEVFEQAGFNVRLQEQPPWLDQTEWLKKLTQRSPRIESLSRPTTGGPISEREVCFLESIPSAERLWLNQSGLNDAQLRRILDQHDLVTHLNVDGNELTDAILPDIAALPRLFQLSIDSEQVTMASLNEYADKLDNPDFVTATAGTRLRQRFLDASENDATGFPGMFAEHPWTTLYKDAIARGLPGNSFELLGAIAKLDDAKPIEIRRARFTPRYRHRQSGQPMRGVVGIDFGSTDERFPSLRLLTDSEFEALASIRKVWLFEMTGVDPVQKLPATLQVESFGSSLRTPEIRDWLGEQTGLRYQRYWEVVGTEDSFSDIDLSGHTNFKFDADRILGNYLAKSRRMTFDDNTPEYVHPITGEFLNTIVETGDVTELIIRGRLPVGYDLTPVFVDFSKFESLTEVTLVQLALNDASLETLARLPNLASVSLGDLPHVTADGLDILKQSLGPTKPVLGERLRSL